jgi:FkbM family methyltransferase
MKISEFIYTVLLRPAPLRWLANRLIVALLPQTRTVSGAIIHLNPTDPVVSGALTFGVYENEEIAFFIKWYRRCVDDGAVTFVDIGANVGLYTGLALRLSPSKAGTILCVEPSSENRRYLERTIVANSSSLATRATVLPLALADRRGEAMLFVNPDNKGDNHLWSNAEHDQWDRETVRVDTLDHVCAEHGIESVDFIKMDVQGAEGQVIAGAANILACSRDCVMIMELWPDGLRKCGSDAVECLVALRNAGFQLFELVGKKLRLISGGGGDKQFISGISANRYKNLVALKGKWLAENPAGTLR